MGWIGGPAKKAITWALGIVAGTYIYFNVTLYMMGIW